MKTCTVQFCLNAKPCTISCYSFIATIQTNTFFVQSTVETVLKSRQKRNMKSVPPDVHPIVDAAIAIISLMVVRRFHIGQKAVDLMSSLKGLATTEEYQHGLQQQQQQQKIYATSAMTSHDRCAGQHFVAMTSPLGTTNEDQKAIYRTFSKTILAIEPILPIAGFIVASMAMKCALSYVLPNERKIVVDVLPNERKIAVETVIVDGPFEQIVVVTVIVDGPFEHGFWWLDDKRNLRPGPGDSWMEPI